MPLLVRKSNMKRQLLTVLFVVNGCFNPTGNETSSTTDASTSTTTNIIISASSNPTSTSFTSSSTTIFHTTSDTFSVTSTVANTTTSTSSFTTSTGISESTSSSGSTTDPTTGNIPDLCGNCILDPGEECDPCLYDGDNQSQCTSQETDFGKCVILFPPSGLMYRLDGPLVGMQTPAMDKEEADLFCKIFTRNLTATAYEWTGPNGNMSNPYGYAPVLGFLMKQNYNNVGTLLTSISILTNETLYYYDYADVPFPGNLDGMFGFFCE